MPFQEFIRRLEWSCGASSSQDLEMEILEQLGQFSGDIGPEDPARKQKYEQLLRCLLDILSSGGEKSLTCRELREVLSRPTLTQYDRARIKNVENLSVTQNNMLRELQVRIEQIDCSGFNPVVFGVAADILSTAAPGLTLPAPPPVVAKICHRSATVDNLSQTLDSPTWMVLHGSVGIGKSHLAYLIAEKVGGILLGVSMRDISASDAVPSIKVLVEKINSNVILNSSSDGVVFLDDIPEIDPGSRFEAMLINLVRIITDRGYPVISTCRRPSPKRLGDFLTTPFVAIESPLFSKEDTKELFIVHGVDGNFLTEEKLTSMNAICGGHPIILTALARHIAARKNEPDRALVQALLSRTHRKDIDLETARVVLRTVEFEGCRNLLYRLASAAISLNEDEIRSIAAVVPRLSEPTTCIALLDGLWLRRTSDSRYEVSPLARPLGKDLPKEETKSVHRELARIVFGRGRISPWEFVQAILSLVTAGETNLAALHILRTWINCPDKCVASTHLHVLYFFPTDRDHGLSPHIEIALRGIQAITAIIQNENPSPFISRIKVITEVEDQSVAQGATLAGLFMLTSTLEIPMPYAVFAASLIERFRGEVHPSMATYQQEFHLILPTVCVHNWDDLEIYLKFLGALPDARRQQLCAVPEFQENLQLMVYKALLNDTGDVTEGAFDKLKLLQDRCLSLGLDLLAAYAVEGRLVILGEYRRDIVSMLAEADLARQASASDQRSIAMIDVTAGQQLLINKRAKEGLELLKRGLRDPDHIIGYERTNRLVDALCAAWDTEENAKPFADELSEILSSGKLLQDITTCQIHAQLGIVRWKQGLRVEALSHLESATVRFLELDDSMIARQIGAGLNHALGYYASILETGQPPQECAEGGQYCEPTPHMFYGLKEGMAKFWKVRQGPALLQLLLARLAEYLGMNDAANMWTDRAINAACEGMFPGPLVILGPRAIARLIGEVSWARALEIAIIYGRARVFAGDKQFAGSSIVDDPTDFNPQEIPTNPEDRVLAEMFSLSVLSRIFVIELCGQIQAPEDNSRLELLDLSAVIKDYSKSSELPGAWVALSESIALCAEMRLTDEQHSASLQETSDRGLEYARFLSHGLLTMRADVGLGQALVSQISMLHRLTIEAPSFGISVDQYAISVSQFWIDSLERAAFQFHSPRELNLALDKALASPPLAGARITLRAVLSSLPVPLPAEIRSWLNKP